MPSHQTIGPLRDTAGAGSIQSGMELQTTTPTSLHEPLFATPGYTDPEAANTNTTTASPRGQTRSAELDSGWKPWSVVAGSFCLTVATYGILSSIGLFQTYWQEHQLAEEDSTDISWILSMFGFLDCLVAAPFGVLFDQYGSRLLLPAGCTVYLASFVGLAFATTYSHFMACFVVAGLSAAVPTTVAFSVVSHWFSARRGLAMGIVTVGAAAGGIFFSMVLKALFGSFSWKVSILALFAILTGLMVAGNVLVHTNPDKEERASSEKDFREWLNCFRSVRFWLLCYCIFVYELVLFVQWGSIPSYSVLTSLGDQFQLMMVYNVGAIFGRSLPPWLADRRLGPLNTTLIMNTFTLLVVAALWLPLGDQSAVALFFVVAFMGVGTGSFVPLAATCVGTLCDPENIGTWLGCCYTVISFSALVGNPISQAILNWSGPRALVALLAVLLGSGLFTGLVLRWLCHGRAWIWRGRI
ncbi:MFS general substrate transporter [Phialemonium atrogriseum]|uniref:MFS general substrate transporter n=1 Tax=Phialemonium atrogriseum TaxID=1093897 RepID=A0AAJ0FI25_9PEZI|nr:MFS general substrate transporter [Phialemonium atrogriseum]KAK1768327.1 MFS general substrate transporter [Phialemonium atrogriseum]